MVCFFIVDNRSLLPDTSIPKYGVIYKVMLLGSYYIYIYDSERMPCTLFPAFAFTPVHIPDFESCNFLVFDVLFAYLAFGCADCMKNCLF